MSEEPVPYGAQRGAIVGFAHVGIAVRSLEPAIERWTRALGFTLEGTEVLESMGLKLAFLRAGDAVVELLEPTRDDSAVGKFLEKRGEGIHHLSFFVEDLSAALAKAEASGLDLIDRTPRSGSHGTEIAFLHPRTLGGVLVELCRRRKEP
jgi:methylmalonyl-CoA/ethylmalonyl-CoA epimerase